MHVKFNLVLYWSKLFECGYKEQTVIGGIHIGKSPSGKAPDFDSGIKEEIPCVGSNPTFPAIKQKQKKRGTNK